MPGSRSFLRAFSLSFSLSLPLATTNVIVPFSYSSALMHVLLSFFSLRLSFRLSSSRLCLFRSLTQLSPGFAAVSSAAGSRPSDPVAEGARGGDKGGWRPGGCPAARWPAPAQRDGARPPALLIAPGRRPGDPGPRATNFCRGGMPSLPPVAMRRGGCSRGARGRGDGGPRDPKRVRVCSWGRVSAPPGAER